MLWLRGFHVHIANTSKSNIFETQIANTSEPVSRQQESNMFETQAPSKLQCSNGMQILFMLLGVVW
jgi:hypothetical protein